MPYRLRPVEGADTGPSSTYVSQLYGLSYDCERKWKFVLPYFLLSRLTMPCSLCVEFAYVAPEDPGRCVTVRRSWPRAASSEAARLWL